MYQDYSKCFMYYLILFSPKSHAAGTFVSPVTHEETEAVSDSVISLESHSGRAVVRTKQSGSLGFYLPCTRAVHSISGLFWFRQIYLAMSILCGT